MSDETSIVTSIVNIMIYLFGIALILSVFVAIWRLFSKAGKPGVASLIPIYNTVVYIQIAGRPAWWILLLLVPFVNIIVIIFLALQVGKAFGKGKLFSIFWLLLFPVVGILIIGFGKSVYNDPSGNEYLPQSDPNTTPQPPVQPQSASFAPTPTALGYPQPPTPPPIQPPTTVQHHQPTPPQSPRPPQSPYR